MSRPATSSTARSTGPATPPSPGCPVVSPTTTCAGCRPTRSPRARSSSTDRVWLHRVGTDPDTDTLVFGDGLDATNYYGVTVSRDGRWLSISAAAGTEPRNDLWVADISTSSPDKPELITVQEGVDAQTSLHFGRDGLIYAYTNADSPRGRILVSEPGVWSLDEWRGPGAGGPRSRPGRMGDPRRRRAPRPGPARGQEPSRGRTHPPSRPPFRRRDGLGARCRAWAPSPASATGPEGGHEAWFGYTDHVDATVGLPLRRTHGRHHAVGHAHQARSTSLRSPPSRSSTVPRTAPTSGCSSSAGPTPTPGRRRPS